MTDRTAFPWVPATRWQLDNLGPEGGPRYRPLYRVTVEHPSPGPDDRMLSVRGSGATPDDALSSLLLVASWWLDYDGRRGGTPPEVYATLHEGAGLVYPVRGQLGRGGPVRDDPPEVPF